MFLLGTRLEPERAGIKATAISVVLAPIVMTGATALSARLTRDNPALAVEPRPTSRLGHRAVVCGYGEVGRTVAGALASRFEVVVVDQGPSVIILGGHGKGKGKRRFGSGKVHIKIH